MTAEIKPLKTSWHISVTVAHLRLVCSTGDEWETIFPNAKTREEVFTHLCTVETKFYPLCDCLKNPDGSCSGKEV